MIIGMCGAARSGKDTVASLLVDFFGGPDKAHLIQIAGPLKAFCRDVFDWTTEHTDGDKKDVPDRRYPRPCAVCNGTGKLVLYHSSTCPHCEAGVTFLTPRQAMQTLGNDWSRPLYEPIWALKAARVALQHARAGKLAVVTDCRFIRDIKAVKDVGGVIVQTHRQANGLVGDAAMHPSEIERNSPEFQALVDCHLYNQGTINDLGAEVAYMMKNLFTRG